MRERPALEMCGEPFDCWPPAAALKTAAGARVNKPKQQEQRKPASKSGASYVQAAHAAVKPAPVSEKEEAAVEGRRMVAELDDFDAGR